MNSLKKLVPFMSLIASYYDNISKNYYNTADIFGVLSQSCHTAAQQALGSELLSHPHHLRILDLGVGDGTFLKLMHQNIPNAELTGIDVSKEMLKIAQLQVPFHSIQCSAADADKHLPIHSQDLIIAHFISAYVPVRILFQQAKTMSKANGYFSFVTSTYESFPESQTQIANFVAQDTLIGNLVGHYYKSILSRTPVASGMDEIHQLIEEFDFKLVHHQRIEIPIYFEDIEKLTEYAIHGGWFFNLLPETSFAKDFILERIKRFVARILKFPHRDTQVIDVLLLKK